jgi:Cof subfamily protein (haloacid dehalogenase superfamily)
MPIRLIAADLDGTFLNSAHRVMPLTEKAIRESRARGVLFTVATGKSFTSTTGLIEQFDIQIPVICGNGTLVHAPDGTILHEDLLPREYAVEAVRLARAAGMTPVVTSGTGLLAPQWDHNVDVLVAHHEPAPEIIPNLEAALETGHKSHKVVIMEERDPEAMAAFQTQLERTFEGRAQVLQSGLISLVEVLPLGVTKGSALAFILDHLGIPAEETICFGDNCNDLDMIRRAGIGVAMANAPEDVRNDADYVTDSNDEDGVGHALYKLVLNGT